MIDELTTSYNVPGTLVFFSSTRELDLVKIKLLNTKTRSLRSGLYSNMYRSCSVEGIDMFTIYAHLVTTALYVSPFLYIGPAIGNVPGFQRLPEMGELTRL